jgi:glucose/arabinose dehydrogenase
MLPALASGDPVETVATRLEIPWSLAFAPDGRLFLSERPGRIRVIVAGRLKAESVIEKTGLGTASGEFYGIALDPDFSTNHLLYLSHTFPEDHSDRIIRMKIEPNDTASSVQVLLNLPNPSYGGRLKFGPDGFLYATTGSGGQGPGSAGANDAQDLQSLRGKILRLTRDGGVPPGNPFAGSPMPYSLIYAYGFRNSEGIGFDSSGQLYATDHGPVSNDKVHIVFAGRNYGWPGCPETQTCVAPIRLFSPETVPPSGMTFYTGNLLAEWKNSLFFAVLGTTAPEKPLGRHIHRILLESPGGKEIRVEELLFKDQFGRIRDIVQGPDDLLYFTTSNQEPAGDDVRAPGDDRILRIRMVSGHDGGMDAGQPDGGGMDAGQPDGGFDAGGDEGPPVDAGMDAGTPNDGGTSSDGGSGSGPTDGGSGGPPTNSDGGSGSAPELNPIRVNASGCSCAAAPPALYLLGLLGILLLQQGRRR